MCAEAPLSGAWTPPHLWDRDPRGVRQPRWRSHPSSTAFPKKKRAYLEFSPDQATADFLKVLVEQFVEVEERVGLQSKLILSAGSGTARLPLRMDRLDTPIQIYRDAKQASLEVTSHYLLYVR